MKKLILSLSLLAFTQVGNAEPLFTNTMGGAPSNEVTPLSVVDAGQIDRILSTYVLFSNKVLAKGMAFGFSPVVKQIDISFDAAWDEVEMDLCAVSLTGQLGALENGKVVDAPAGVPAPVQSYTEEGRCEDIKESFVL